MNVFDGLAGHSVTISDVQATGFCEGEKPLVSKVCDCMSEERSSSLTVVGTVAARDQLLVLALHREPRLQIVLDGSGVVESTGYDTRDSVRQLKRLVECL
jgi:hypothetical protein